MRVCLRCEGVWLPLATIAAAFVDPKWPGGQAIWWRNSIKCPECVTQGSDQLLEARMVKGVLVDRCHAHGVWLDRTELGRLMGSDADELVELHRRLEVPQEHLDALAERRAKWRDERTARREVELEYQTFLEQAQRERDEAAAKEARRVAERAAIAAGEELEQSKRATQAARQTLGNQLASASEEHAKLVQQLAEHRAWGVKLAAQVEEARTRADALARELAALTDQPV